MSEIFRLVLPSLVKLAGARGVSFSILELNSEYTAGIKDDMDLENGCSILAKSLELLEDCSPFAIYMLSAQYGPAFSSFSRQLLKRFPWMGSEVNSIFGHGGGASLIDLQILWITCASNFRPELL